MGKRYRFALIKEKLRARRGHVLDFAIGEQRIALPEALRTWIRDNADLAMRPATHVKEFTEAAANLLRTEYDVDIPTDRILPTPGGRAAMSAFVACVLEPGDGVLVTEPDYPAFARLATHRHARVHSLLLDPDRAFAPDIGSITGRDPNSIRVIALNYPNNPTGAILSAEIMSQIMDVTGAAQVLFNDATYGLLTFDHRPSSLLHEDMIGDSKVEAVELHSVSKLFPLGPLAVSFLAGSEATMRSISTYSEFAWSPLSLLQLQATTWCLRDSVRLREICEFFADQLERLRRTLIAIGFEPYPTPAGIYSICRVPPRIGEKPVSTAEEAAERLFDEFDLAVVPWDTPSHSYLRFCLVYRPEDLDRLAELAERLQLGPV
ncbi:MAG: pyridoxal phosphate-dependent aminotransferase [Gammaproteobacteria bacterium]